MIYNHEHYDPAGHDHGQPHGELLAIAATETKTIGSATWTENCLGTILGVYSSSQRYTLPRSPTWPHKSATTGTTPIDPPPAHATLALGRSFFSFAVKAYGTGFHRRSDILYVHGGNFHGTCHTD